MLAVLGPGRYKHFIGVAADQRRVWGLYSDGWALASDEAGANFLPLWPASEYAKLCVDGDWGGYLPEEIELDELLSETLPALQEQGLGIAVFPTPTDHGVVPTLAQLESDLRAELSKIE